MSSEQPSDSSWPLDNASTAILDLPDGRKLGYAEYGAKHGQPILYQQGFPGSRREGAGIHDAAVKVGARIIAIDRPGYGLSSMDSARTLLSTAQDVEALARHLELERYGILGVSGGGPYALACARFLPAEKLRAVSIVCGLGSPDMGYRGMALPNYLGWTYVQHYLPGFCRWWFGRMPGARLDLTLDDRLKLLRQDIDRNKARMHQKDRDFYADKDWQHMHLRAYGDAFAQGKDGFSLDFKLLNEDFGFKIEDIRKDLPFQLWYARMDGNVPLQHGEKIATRIGDSACLKVSDDTHASIWANWKEDYLGELVKAVRA